MQYGLYLSAAGLQAQEKRQSVITNNLANAKTIGFKRDLAVMQSRANAVDEDPSMAGYRTPILGHQGGGTNIGGAGVDLTQAAFENSSSQTDVAIEGKGFFTVQGDGSTPLLTRDGRFLISRDNTLVTGDGRSVLGSDGNAIKVNANIPMTIDGSGNIRQGGQTVATLGMADVTDNKALIKVGDNLMTVNNPKALTTVSTATNVRQNMLEQSGVDPMVEMVNMMEGQRAFEANAKMISYQDTMLSEVNSIGKVA